MESVGEFFKHVRETKGLTIDEVASKTRIRTDFLQAVEDGNFARLPDQVFAKGFVRTYARSLGLDEEDAMNRFAQSAGAFYDKREERERLRVKQAEDERRRRTSRKTVVLAVGVILLLLVLFLREQSAVVVTPPVVDAPPAVQPPTPLGEGRFDQGVKPISEQPASAPGGLPEAATAGVPQIPAAEEVGASTSSTSAEPPGLPVMLPDDMLGGVTGEAPLVLDIEALEVTWVVVQIDGGSPHEALLQPGERIAWRGQEQFTLTLGNAGGVRVVLNGETKGPFGPSGTVARGIVLPATP